MSSKRYTEEFKIEAVKQVTDRGHSAPDVTKRHMGSRSGIRSGICGIWGQVFHYHI